MHACYYALAWDKYEIEKKTVVSKDPVYVKKNSEMWNDFVVAPFFDEIRMLQLLLYFYNISSVCFV